MKIGAISQCEFKNAEMINFAHYGYQLANFKCWQNATGVVLVQIVVFWKQNFKKSVNLKISVLSALNIYSSLFERVVTVHYAWPH